MILKNFLQKYKNDRSGNLSVITAFVAIPMMLATTIALDTQKAHTEVGNLQDALDSAVLSAVMKGNLTVSSRGEHAKKVFKENYTGKLDVNLTPFVTENRVTLKADSHLPTTLSAIVGINDINIENRATAELVKGTVTCLLVLAKKNRQALVFGGDSVFDSPDCGIQVNSTDHRALWGGSNRPPIAADICVTGGYYGRFGTHVKTECRAVEDPYKDVVVPAAGDCDYWPGVSLKKPIAGATHYDEPVMVSNRTRRNAVLSPGHYCGGIKLNHNVTFEPGVYHISDGALIIGETANIKAEGVTFVLRGDEARLHMMMGAKADITATKSGVLGGIAFFQVPNAAKWPQSLSLVKSGGDLSVNGVFYFPSGDLHVQGTANVGAKASATSFIAHTLKIDADVRTTINVDHDAAGLPPLEPQTDETARLVSDHAFE